MCSLVGYVMRVNDQIGCFKNYHTEIVWDVADAIFLRNTVEHITAKRGAHKYIPVALIALAGKMHAFSVSGSLPGGSNPASQQHIPQCF